jgi:cytochrome P450
MPTTPNKAISLFIAPDGEHGRQRKIFTPAFSDRALKQQEPLFLKYINQLVSILQQSVQEDPETKFDMVRMYNFTTFDVMGDLTFGEPLHMLDNAEYDPWVRIIFASIKAGTFVRVLSCYSWARRLFDKFLPASMDKKRLDHFNHSATRVAKRMEKGRDTEGVDLWDLVINQKDGRGLTRPQMEVNASLFMIAGTETTATLLAGLTYLLTGNPECSKKLSQEIRGEFESAADMTMERLAALPYLNACIKEALRIYPPVPVTMARRTPPDGSTILGEFVPPGTIVGIAQHVMYEKKTLLPFFYPVL